MRAKQDSQGFAKLTNECATPPTKLYSPFNIYLESSSRDAKRKQALQRNKAVLLGELDGGQPNGLAGGHFNISMELECDQQPMDVSMRESETPAKVRIALQHKKHLMQANKFTFDSPTGRLRETVRDVERFQQCIEDISKAIKARGH